MTPCIVCKEDVDKPISGVSVHMGCLRGKSPQIVQVEVRYGHPIEEVLVACLKKMDTWEARYTELGVSKVTIYCWVKRFLNMTPLQAVSLYKNKVPTDRPSGLQTGSRDYLKSNHTMFIPE